MELLVWIFSETNAKFGLKKEGLSLLKFPNYNHGSLDWRARAASGTVGHSVLTILSTLDGRDNEAERTHKFRRFEGTKKEECVYRPYKISLQEAESWVVKTTYNVSVVSWVKQMVIGMLYLPKRQANTEIVCVEPAQIPFEILLIQVNFPELWITRTFATIREESGSRTRSPGT
jgi:hypothetical protein